MPAAFRYIQDMRSPAYRQLEDAYVKEYNERKDAIDKRWAYYKGHMPKPLKVEADGYDDNVMISKVDQVADKVVSFLFGDGLTFDAGGDDKRTPDDENIEALWRENKGKLLLHDIGLTGTVAGHNFVRLEPKDGFPRLVALNPVTCSVFWHAEDIARVLWYRLQYTMGDSGKRVDYVRYAAIDDGASEDKWLELVYKMERASQWTPVSTNEWDYPWPPIVEWKNMPLPHEYYGASDVGKISALNDQLNFVLSDWNRILKHHAAPKTVVIGADVNNIVESQVGGLIVVNKDKNLADVKTLEMQSDLKASQELAAILEAQIWQSARMVDPQTIKDKVGQLTNFGLRVIYLDALRKTETKRLLYEEAFEQIAKRGLELAGLPVPDQVVTNWPDVLPEDSAEVATALLAELAAKIIDRETYRNIRGYDHEQIEQRLQDEAASEDTLGSRLLSAFEKGA